VDVGDVNNDGILETVILTEESIIIYQMVNNRMVKATEIPISKLSHPLGVDIGDVNGNGTPEIFISSLAPERNRANSYVLEFDGKIIPRHYNEYIMVLSNFKRNVRRTTSIGPGTTKKRGRHLHRPCL